MNKKLSCRRGTARRAVSVETVRNVAQVFVELRFTSPATGEWHSRSWEMTRIDRPWYFLLVVCSNNVSVLHHLCDTTTFTVQTCRKFLAPVALGLCAPGAAIIGGRAGRHVPPNILVGDAKVNVPPLIAHLVKFLGLRWRIKGVLYYQNSIFLASVGLCLSDPLTRGSAPGPLWGLRPDPHHSEEIAATERYGVRPSVSAWAHSSKPAAVDRLLQQRRAAGECRQCHVVSVRK